MMEQRETDVKVPLLSKIAYGMGDVGCNFSWMFVGNFLMIFYTDVFGLGVGAVAMLMLIAKVWDGINDPMMGTIMERTHTRWGRFRPYIFAGAPLLVVFTILTFTVPGFGGPAKLIYAYVTYIGLGMAYTMTNVPYTALPAVMTHDPKEVNRLNAAQMMGMTIGQIVLNLTVLPLVTFIGGGDQANGYQKTAALLAIVALPMFWAVAVMSKEKVTVEKKEQGKVLDGLKMIAKNKNLLCAMFYSFFNMFGILGRISVAVFFYMHCVQNFALITVFMMMQMAVGTLVMPFAPKFVEKFGKRNGAIISMVIQGAALLLLYFGPSTSIPFNFLCMIIYGTGYIAGPSGSGMIVDAIDDFDDKYGVRNDGMAFSFNGTAIKIATAIANSVFLLVMGAFGYVGGGEITSHVQTGINLAANMLPGIVFLIGIIPLALYDLDKPGYMEAVRERLTARNAEKKAEE